MKLLRFRNILTLMLTVALLLSMTSFVAGNQTLMDRFIAKYPNSTLSNNPSVPPRSDGSPNGYCKACHLYEQNEPPTPSKDNLNPFGLRFKSKFNIFDNIPDPMNLGGPYGDGRVISRGPSNQGPSTDIAKEFNPNNLGYHPVVAPGKNQPITHTGFATVDLVGPFEGSPFSYANSWDSNKYNGMCVEIIEGTGKDQVVTITGHNTGGITSTDPNPPTADATSKFVIRNCSTYFSAWPRFSGGTISMTAGNPVITISNLGVNVPGGIPSTVIPGWYIYAGSASPNQLTTSGWFQVKSIAAGASDPATTTTTLTVTPTPQSSYNGPYALTAGLGNTFVPPYGPWSVMGCADCHDTDDSKEPSGPHASARNWMLRTLEPQTFPWYYGFGANPSEVMTISYPDWNDASWPQDSRVPCWNCHRADVYTPGSVPTSGSFVNMENRSLGRVPHPPYLLNIGVKYNKSDGSPWCLNCHASQMGGMHGSNVRLTGGNSFGGRRLLNGYMWTAVTRSATNKNGSCVTSCGYQSNNGTAYYFQEEDTAKYARANYPYFSGADYVADVVQASISAVASGNNWAGDKVVITFNRSTMGNNVNEVINTALQLNGGTGSWGSSTATWDSTKRILTVALSADGTPTVKPGDTITLGGTITDKSGSRLASSGVISGKFGAAISSAIAADANNLAGIQTNDTVTIKFSGATNGATINNVDTVLSLTDAYGNVHSWGSATRSVWNSTNNTLIITFDTSGTAPTVKVGDRITLNGINNGFGHPIVGSIVIGGSFDPAPVYLQSATAADTTHNLAGVQTDDTVTIKFSGATNGATINNVDTVLSLTDAYGNVHSWGSATRSAWNSTNDTLIITLDTSGTSPTVKVGDRITLNGINDSFGRAIVSFSYVGGSFGPEPVSLKSAIAAAPGLQTGDTVTIKFSGATNGPNSGLSTSNINTVLNIGHSWGSVSNVAWNPTNDTLIITLGTNATGTVTVAVGDTITVNGINDSIGHPIVGSITIAGNFGTALSAAAADTSNHLAGVQTDDTVTIKFSGATNGATINNVDTVLSLTDAYGNIHSWGSATRSVWNSTNDTLIITFDTSGTSPTVKVGDRIALNGINNSFGHPIVGSIGIDGSFGPAPVVLQSATAADTANHLAGIQTDDTVTIKFSGATSAPTIDKNNINNVLALTDANNNIHSWLGGGNLGGTTQQGVWSKTTNDNDTLTITLNTGATVVAGNPGGDTIILDGITIKDIYGHGIVDSIQIGGSFGTDPAPVSLQSATAAGTLARGVKAGDTVTIKFSGATNGLDSNYIKGNIDTVLNIGHSWGAVSSVNWASNPNNNDTLTITLYTGATVAVGDLVTVNGINDSIGRPITDKIPITGSFDTPPGAIGYWKFDGDAKDSSPTGANGVISGATFMEGKFESALYFNGVRDYVSFPAINLSGNNNTIEAWVKPESFQYSAGAGVILSSANNHLFLYSDGYIGFNNNVKANTPLILNDWNHVLITGNTVNGITSTIFYINGVPSGSSSGNYLTWGNTPLKAGWDYFSYEDFPFNGLIDELVLYNTYLDATQVKTRYGTWMKSVRAADQGTLPAHGPAGDKVVILFDGEIKNPPTGNVDDILALNNNHTWGASSGSWTNTGGNSNDTLTITLPASGATVATGDVITPQSIQDAQDRAIIGTRLIEGSFSPIPSFPDVNTLGYWDMDEAGVTTTVTDGTTNNKHGAIYGATQRVQGISGNALSFDGSTGTAYVDIPDANYDTLTNAISIEFWMKASYNETGRRIISGNAFSIRTAQGPNYATMINPGIITGSQDSGNFQGADWIVGTSNLFNNQWHHLVLTWDGTTQKFYVDGNPVGANSAGEGQTLTPQKKMRIAREIGNSSFNFNGSIDGVVIYDKALTDGEVSQRYNAR